MTTLVTTQFNNTTVLFSQDDGYLHATAIAKSFGKQTKDYLKTDQTKAYLKALAENLTTRTKILVKQNQLVRVKNGGNERGTWLHPKLAVHFARWLSAEFAVWCDEQIERILKRQKTTKLERTPLKNAVQILVDRTEHLNYPNAYDLVHQAFNVTSITEIPLSQLPQATEYVYGLILKLNDSQPKQTPLSEDDQIHTKKWHMVGSQASSLLFNELKEMEDMVYEMQNMVSKVQKLNTAVNGSFDQTLRVHSKHSKEAMPQAKVLLEKYTK